MTEQKPNASAAETDSGANWANLPKAKQHQLLVEVDAELRGCHRTKTVTVFGRRYTLRTLDPHESMWTNRYMPTEEEFSILGAAKSLRAPTVAAALVAIGPADEAERMVPVEELFQLPDDLPRVTRELIEGSVLVRRDWVRTEVLRWLSQPDKHDALLVELYGTYLELHKQRNEALEGLGPLVKRTPTGESSATSSPEKGSFSATTLSGG